MSMTLQDSPINSAYTAPKARQMEQLARSLNTVTMQPPVVGCVNSKGQ